MTFSALLLLPLLLLPLLLLLPSPPPPLPPSPSKTPPANAQPCCAENTPSYPRRGIPGVGVVKSPTHPVMLSNHARLSHLPLKA